MDVADTVERALALVDEGEQGSARALLMRVLSMATSARDAEEASAIAEATVLLVELDVVVEPEARIDEHLERMRLLTGGFDDARTAEARARAELARVEFVHGLDDVDPVLHVQVLQRALEIDTASQQSTHAGVRRAAAEAALTAQMIRRWLGQDADAIASALDALALRLGGESDARMSAIRVEAIVTSARLRIENGRDLTGVAEMLRIAVTESRRNPAAEGWGLDAALLRADLAVAGGENPRDALVEARRLLAEDPWPHTPARAARAGRHLRHLLERLAPEARDAVAAEEWPRLLERYAADADAEIRSVALAELLRDVGSAPDITASALALLKRADLTFRADDDPTSALARFGVVAKIAVALGHPESAASVRDTAEAVRVSVAAEERFAALWDAPETAPVMAALVLDRALRLADLGRTGEALDTLARLAATVRAAGSDTARLERAQAAYWTGRFLRESGDAEASRRALDEVVREFAHDPSGDVRVWAANALWSAWRSDRVHADEAADLRRVFAARFDHDPDVRIRRLDATGRLGEAVDAHERGDTARAIALLNEIVDRFGDADDGDLRDTVRRARENLHILSLSTSGATEADDEAVARYRSLRDRLYAADELTQHGSIAEAEQRWKAVIDETAGTDDLDLAMLRLAALDTWAGWAEETGSWEQLAALARQATVIRAGADARAERVRARAYLRLGIALGRLGDPRAAIQAYEALDALAAGSPDGEIATTRQQAVYNRAVTIDDLGDGLAALAAYEHVIAVHGHSVATAGGRLRCAKALRNQALIFAGLGRTAEAAGAHRRVLDLAAGSTDPPLLERVKKSAFDLAAAFTALGDHASAASTYAWTRSAAHLGLSPEEARAAARAEKQARRLSR